MLAIRMQRTGRKGHAMFRVVVQDSRRTPTSGKIVMLLGSYDPHTKAVVLNKDKAAYYLEHGAQPSDRVVKLLVAEGVKLPDWVNKPGKEKKRDIRNAEKLRRNRPADAEASADKPDEPAEETAAEAADEKPAEVKAEEPTDTTSEAAAEADKPAAEPNAEAPAEEEKSGEKS